MDITIKQLTANSERDAVTAWLLAGARCEMCGDASVLLLRIQ